MGTYDTIGGTPISPDVECPPCEVCDGALEGDGERGGCVCRECPVCHEAGNPRCYTEHGLTATRVLCPRCRWPITLGAEVYRYGADGPEHVVCPGTEDDAA